MYVHISFRLEYLYAPTAKAHYLCPRSPSRGTDISLYPSTILIYDIYLLFFQNCIRSGFGRESRRGQDNQFGVECCRPRSLSSGQACCRGGHSGHRRAGTKDGNYIYIFLCIYISMHMNLRKELDDDDERRCTILASLSFRQYYEKS